MIRICNYCKTQEVEYPNSFISVMCFSCYIKWSEEEKIPINIILDIIKQFRHLWIKEQAIIENYVVANSL
jgi:hypothetical protein